MKIIKRISSALLVLIALVVFSCSQEKAAPLSMHSIIPLPASVIETDENFVFNGSTKIVTLGDASQINLITEYFKSSVYHLTGLNLGSVDQEQENAVVFELNSNLGREAISLKQ